MKKLFATFLSLQLIISPVAWAAQEETELPAEFAGFSESYANAKDGGYDFYAKQVLVLATSSIGSSIATQCLGGLKIPSIAVYMGGSLVNIAAEVIGAKAENDNHKKKMSQIKLVEEKMQGKGGGELQKEALIQRKQDEIQTRDFIKKRKLWMIAVGAIYTTAMALSILEETTGHAMGVSTGTTSCNALAATLSAGCLTAYAACYAGHLSACSATMATGAVAAEATLTSAGLATGTSTCASSAVYSPACMAYLNVYQARAYAGCSAATPAKAISWNTLLGMAYGFGASKMDGGKVSQYGSMLMTMLPLVIPAVGKLVPIAYNYPIPRSITFGASTALVGTVVAGLIQRQKIAEDNIEKLDRVLSKFEADTKTKDGVKEDDPGSKDPKKNTTINPHDMKELADGKLPKSCIRDNNSNYEISSAACSNSLKMSKMKFDFGSNLPTLSAATNLTNDLTNSLADGDMARAEAIAGQLGSMAAKIKDVKDKISEEYNKNQKQNGKPETDFKKSVAAQVASLQSTVNEAAKSKGIDLASMNNQPSTSGDKEINSEATPAVTKAPGQDVAVPNADFSFSESTTTEELPTTKTASLSESLDEYESSEQDISSKSDVSIFKQLSNRYLLNYTRIFEKKKSLEEAPK